jgi:uncharacterized protein (TIRG00374 family)
MTPIAKKWLQHFILLFAGIALYFFWVDKSNLNEWQLEQLQLLPFFVVVFATFIITAAIAARWKSINHGILGRKIAPWFQYYYYYIVSLVTVFIFPKDITGIGFRTYWEEKLKKVDTAKAKAGVLIDRLFDLFVLFVLFIGSLPFWFGVDIFNGIIILVVFSLIFGLVALLFLDKIDNFLNTLLKIGRKTPFIGSHFPKTFPITFTRANKFLKTYYLSIIKYAGIILRFVFVIIAFNIPLDYQLIIIGTPFALLTYLVSFTPGRLGILEAGWFGVLMLAGASACPALFFVIAQRILEIISVAIVGMLTQLIYFLYKGEKEVEAGHKTSKKMSY